RSRSWTTRATAIDPSAIAATTASPHQKRIRIERLPAAADAASVHRRACKRLPEIEGREAAVGAPRLADLEHAGGRRHLVEAVLHLHRLADAEVAAGEDVRPFQVEEQEHLRGPDPEAAHGDDLGDDLLVGQLAEPVQLELAGEHVGGEVA